jgi:hypothetical protein
VAETRTVLGTLRARPRRARAPRRAGLPAGAHRSRDLLGRQDERVRVALPERARGSTAEPSGGRPTRTARCASSPLLRSWLEVSYSTEFSPLTSRYDPPSVRARRLRSRSRRPGASRGVDPVLERALTD